jgi:PQQ-dependent catabolism-associated CXXCW motif protein
MTVLRGMNATIGAVLACVMLTVATHAHAQSEPPPEPEGYWQGAMNGPVPATITGGTVVGTADLAELLRKEKPVLIDVVPAPRRPETQTTLWLPLPHHDIPRSVWIPGAGSGVISATMTDYFRRRLNELTANDRGKTLVFYCRVNCWASWNAAKRAIAEGYKRVSWYPDGIEAWQDAGLPTEIAVAEGPGVQ